MYLPSSSSDISHSTRGSERESERDEKKILFDASKLIKSMLANCINICETVLIRVCMKRPKRSKYTNKWGDTFRMPHSEQLSAANMNIYAQLLCNWRMKYIRESDTFDLSHTRTKQSTTNNTPEK